MFKVRTLDVWDTLLRRNCHPECIKLATAQHVLRRYKTRLKEPFQILRALYEQRVETERLIANQRKGQGCDEEYSIEEVIKQWCETTFKEGFEHPAPSEISDFELETEIKNSYVDSEIHEFIKQYPAERTYFLSDFYIDSARMKKLLSAKGLNTLVPDGWVSCDLGLNKRSGQAFQHLNRVYNIEPKSHVHIGDNVWSDVQAPSNLGITAVHYLPEIAHKKRLETESLFESTQSLLQNLTQTILSTETYNNGSAPFQYGVKCAPLFIGYLLWVAEKSIELKLDKLMFMTREGEFFFEVYNALFPDQRHAGIDLPKADILEVSRSSTFLLKLTENSIDVFLDAWKQHKVQNVRSLFNTAKIEISEFKDLLKSLKLGESETIQDPLNDQRILSLINNEKFSLALRQAAESEKLKLGALLAQKSILPGAKSALVDIGWRGSIQDNLSSHFKEIEFIGFYLGLRSITGWTPDKSGKYCFGPNENLATTNNNLFEAASVLEMLCMSPNGTVSGYSEINSKIIPTRVKNEEENSAFYKFSGDFQKGVLFAANSWQPKITAYVVESSDLREPCMTMLENLSKHPPVDLTKEFINSPQNDEYLYGDHYRKNNAPSTISIILSLVSKQHRIALIEYIRRVQWTASVRNMNELGKIQKLSLTLIFTLANKYRLLRMKRLYRAKSKP